MFTLKNLKSSEQIRTGTCLLTLLSPLFLCFSELRASRASRTTWIDVFLFLRGIIKLIVDFLVVRSQCHNDRHVNSNPFQERTFGYIYTRHFRAILIFPYSAWGETHTHTHIKEAGSLDDGSPLRIGSRCGRRKHTRVSHSLQIRCISPRILVRIST